MAQKDIKKLSATELKKQVKKLTEVQEFIVQIGDTDYKLTHDVVFRKSKMYNVMEDLIDFFTYTADNRIEDIELATPYTTLLIFKHFTSLEVPNDIDEAIDFLYVLVDLDALSTIANALPEDEVTKVYELFTERMNELKDSLEAGEEEVEAMLAEIENKEVKEQAEKLVGTDGEDKAE
ncbi:hypothetical protein JDW21_19630 [Bacillus subtilis]|uniref:Uncharacterized protein n=1 Tax=Bacillus phage vB_BsuS_PJN02 TaxID=2920374 RepID=A0AC61TT95_9CAUD|nr:MULTISPECIES: hypothetical protein [Bacillus subtilis group]YP_010681666.1 hypothetical protein PQE76_gp048 [Bacillus phage vB_BsuS_PJN02]MCR4361976.1 hypothetical protein [Bacillus subtilis]UNH58391.1 hypothetical protein [Bacillus phage vB_BsuS_PJN02]UQB84207.1 hypothetical protein KMZ31_19995 [Bacillus amyloliquefaciens]WOF32830.1 hypothetical protein OEJ84_23250 [Bacillus subtilis]